MKDKFKIYGARLSDLESSQLALKIARYSNGGKVSFSRGQNAKMVAQIARDRWNKTDAEYDSMMMMVDKATEKYNDYKGTIKNQEFYKNYQESLQNEVNSGNINKGEMNERLKLERLAWNQEKLKAKTQLAMLAFGEEYTLHRLYEDIYNNNSLINSFDSSRVEDFVLRFNRKDTRNR